MPEPVGLEEPSEATSTEENVDSIQDHGSVEDGSEQCPHSEARVDSEQSPSVTPQEPLNRDGAHRPNPSLNHPGKIQAPISERKSHVLFQMKWHLLLLSFTAALFAVTAWFARATFSISSIANMDSIWNIGISWTLTTLRLLEGVLSICSTTVLLNTFEMIQWALTSRDNGVSSLCLLGLSPTSGYLGTLGLALSRHARWTDRLAASGRISLLTAIWISGVVLFVRTRLVVVYESVDSYEVTGGVGQFNGSYVPEYLKRYKDTNQDYGPAVLPYSTVITASSLVVNRMHSTAVDAVVCEDNRECHSYLLSGGLIMTTPWPPTDYTSYPVVNLRMLPATQIDFVRGIHNDTFHDAEDCTVFGEEGTLIGIKFCLARSQTSTGSLFAGLFVCTQGVIGNDCQTDTNTKPPAVTTTFSIHQRHASITTSRSNFSILSIDQLGPPLQYAAPDVEGLKEAFNWLFNFSAAGIPAPSSIAQYFWSAKDQLDSEYWSIEPYQIFQSLLAYPFWLFNPNNFGNVHLNAKTIVPGLPPDFYTTASIGNPYEKIVIDRPMFILFCVLQGLVQGFAWGWIIWLCTTNPILPETSSHPIIDFAVRTRFLGLSQSTADSQAGYDPTNDLAVAAGDKPIRQVLKGRRTVIHDFNKTELPGGNKWQRPSQDPLHSR